MIKLRDMNLCTSCGACVNACRKRCISMREDGDGFLVPSIDRGNCVECGLCEQVCARVNSVSFNQRPRYAIAAWAKDASIRGSSSSGGIFSVLAQRILKDGGVINGVTFDDEFSLKHKLVASLEELLEVRGSRYVQSDVGMTYAEIRRALNENRVVLFTSTPCQVAGLKGYLGREYENLITCDFICHGVPSPGYFKNYIRAKEKESGQNAVDYVFRDVAKWGWAPALRLADKTIVSYDTYTDAYMVPFLAGLNYNESCYNCPFAKPERCADITLGDFWSIKDYSLFTKKYAKGCSLVLLNSAKGEFFFSRVSDECEGKKYPLYTTLANKQLWHPSKRPSLREDFYSDVYSMDFDTFATKYGIRAKPRHPLHHIADAMRWVKRKGNALKYLLKVKCGGVKI